jgi:hypothetical protein
VLIYVPDNGRDDVDVAIDQYGRQVGPIIIYTPTPDEHLTTSREEMEAELAIQDSWATIPDDALAASQGTADADRTEEMKAREAAERKAEEQAQASRRSSTSVQRRT